MMKFLVIVCMFVSMPYFVYGAAGSSHEAHKPSRKRMPREREIISSNPEVSFKTISVEESYWGRKGTYEILIEDGREGDRNAMLRSIKRKLKAGSVLPTCGDQACIMEQAFMGHLDLSELPTPAFNALSKPRVTVLLSKVVTDEQCFVDFTYFRGQLIKLGKRAGLLVPSAQRKIIAKYLRRRNVQEVIRQKEFGLLKQMLKDEIFTTPESGAVVFMNRGYATHTKVKRDVHKSIACCCSCGDVLALLKHNEISRARDMFDLQINWAHVASEHAELIEAAWQKLVSEYTGQPAAQE